MIFAFVPWGADQNELEMGKKTNSLLRHLVIGVVLWSQVSRCIFFT